MFTAIRSGSRGDLFGGMVSASLAIPLAAGYGMFAFTVLGDEYFAYGALAGLQAGAIAGLICPLLGERTTLVYAPRVTTTFLLGALLYQLVHSSPTPLQGSQLYTVILAFFAIIFLGGVFQSLFGAARLGSIIRFTPQPAMAGLQNAAAVLLFLVQLGNVCGFERNMPFTAVPRHLLEIKPLSLLVAILTFLVMWNARRVTTKVPALLLGLGFGSGVYFLLWLPGLQAQLGPVIGPPVAPESPTPYTALGQAEEFVNLVPLLPLIVGGALALAITSAVDALLCAKLAAPKGQRQAEANHLLLRLGLANSISACFGGITAGINIGPSVANRAFGARTFRSGLVCAAVLLAVITFGFPLLSYLPRAVLSAAIMVIAVQHIDTWSADIVRRIVKRSQGSWWVFFDLAVMTTVAVLSVTINIVLAMFIGVVFAGGLFIIRMNRSVIRRRYSGDKVHSRKARGPRAATLIEQRGSEILVLELQGVLFFGSGELLSDEIRLLSSVNLRTLVLDLRRITEIDLTGARVLSDIHDLLAFRKQDLIIALPAKGDLQARLAETGVLEVIGSENVFVDVDRALERAEDNLIGSASLASDAAETLMSFTSVDILSKMTPDELAHFEERISRRKFQPGSVVFEQGSAGEELFLVISGHASAYLKNDSANIRLATFGPGTIFGELAILDSQPRSASIVSDDDLECAVLSREQFHILTTERPAIAIKLLEGVSRELTGRLRRANRTIHELEA